jgi:hypothetical protein
MLKILEVDEKWSIQYDPNSNDRPLAVFRYGELNSTTTDWDNVQVAMFYALLEALKQTS